MTTTVSKSALELLNEAIHELEARLNLEHAAVGAPVSSNDITGIQKTKGKKEGTAKPVKSVVPVAVEEDIPDICKIEFKVGVITKVWVHETADKLYCEEIDVNEETGPRQIASGLRHHFTIEQMLGQRLLVVANLKPKNLVGFKSHGMVLCASSKNDQDIEIVEFVEPPMDATIGEVITFDGLPSVQPAAPNVVEKKKLWISITEGLSCDENGIANWNGHAFMTSTGPCRTRTIRNGILR